MTKKTLLLTLSLALLTLTGCSDKGVLDTPEKVKEISELRKHCEAAGGSIYEDVTFIEFFTGRTHFECDMSSVYVSEGK